MPKRCGLCEEFATRALDERVVLLLEAAGPAAEHDVDGIHDVRVASRRIRSLLRAHKQAFKKRPLKEFQWRVKAVTRGLGTARELDVTIGLLEKRRRKLKGPARMATTQILRLLRAEREDESANVEASVHLIQDCRFSNCLDTLKGGIKAVRQCYLETASAALVKRLDALSVAHTRWRQTHSEEDLHQVRIAFKRMRYTCEIFKALYDKPLQQFIGTMKKAQGHLGDWNDLRVMRNHVERLARRMNGDATEGVSELHSQLDRDADALLEAFEGDADVFFTDESLSKIRALLTEPTHPCCAPTAREGA